MSAPRHSSPPAATGRHPPAPGLLSQLPCASGTDCNIGFLLAVILTLIPFGLVMTDAFEDTATTALIVMSLGVVQIIVHMVYFLHMNRKAQGGWTFLAFVFTAILLAITLVGSLWVMYHLNYNLMPATNHNLRIAP